MNWKFWEKKKVESKEGKVIRLAKDLRLAMIDLGYKSPHQYSCNCINVWEHDTGLFKVDEYESKIEIKSTI